MRKDMGKVIIDCYRHTFPWKEGNSRKYNIEDLPSKKAMKGKRGFSEKEKNDRISPFNRFLMKMEKERKDYDEVYSMVKKGMGSAMVKNHLVEHFHESAFKGEDGKIKLKPLF